MFVLDVVVVAVLFQMTIYKMKVNNVFMKRSKYNTSKYSSITMNTLKPTLSTSPVREEYAQVHIVFALNNLSQCAWSLQVVGHFKMLSGCVLTMSYPHTPALTLSQIHPYIHPHAHSLAHTYKPTHTYTYPFNHQPSLNALYSHWNLLMSCKLHPSFTFALLT